MSVAAVLLAAGEARRFGSPKQLARIGERSLVRRAAEAALASRCDPVFVVVGAHADAVCAELAGLGVILVHADDWAEGLAASIRAGIHAATHAEPRCDGALLLLADQVRVDADLIDDLVSRFESGEGDAVACAYRGGVGAPALFARRFFPRLAALRGDRGARSLLLEAAAAGEALVRVPFPGGADDVDVPEDLARLAPPRPPNR